MNIIGDDSYKSHRIFSELTRLSEYYDLLSLSAFGFITSGTNSQFNIDSYIFTSMQTSIDSINLLLQSCRINDSYALLRKYYDSTVINIYTWLYSKEHQNINSIIVDKINNWYLGKEKIPEYRVMSEYIRKNDHLKELNSIFATDTRYKNIRSRCNDHTHYNYFSNMLYHDQSLFIDDRNKVLDKIIDDINNIFIQHMSYTFFLNQHYMSSSDYMDALECGLQPEEDSQYLVAPYITEIMNIIKCKRIDVYDYLKNSLDMKIEDD